MALNVLFVCQHGAAKSIMAARYLTQLAQARGLDITAAAAGVEPDEVIPPHVIAGLQEDGLDLQQEAPQPAEIVVSFACDLTALTEDAERFVQWTGVPAVSDGYDAARSAILSRLPAILDELNRVRVEFPEEFDSDPNS
jgi:hypothetical protein